MIPAAPTWPSVLGRLAAGLDLDADSARWALAQVMAGEVTVGPSDQHRGELREIERGNLAQTPSARLRSPRRSPMYRAYRP